LTSDAILKWCDGHGVKGPSIAPGKPMQNRRGLSRSGGDRLLRVESVNGRMRDEVLNETLLRHLAHARALIADWRTEGNTTRLHSALGGQTRANFAPQASPRS
jgi:putative transposase